MAVMGDRVPMFKLRPYKSLLIAALLVGIVGGLLSAYFFVEDEHLSRNRGLITEIFTVVIVVLLLIGAFSRYAFRHLHHRRPGYKRG
jgi:hypothetical protein